jgi:hypothetical protein
VDPSILALAFTLHARTDKANELYQQNCASCHGAQAKGGMGANLSDGVWSHGGVTPRSRTRFPLAMRTWESARLREISYSRPNSLTGRISERGRQPPPKLRHRPSRFQALL